MKGDFDKAREVMSKDDTAVSRLLGMGLALQGAVRRRDDVEKAMEESMMEVIPQLQKRYAGHWAPEVQRLIDADGR